MKKKPKSLSNERKQKDTVHKWKILKDPLKGCVTNEKCARKEVNRWSSHRNNRENVTIYGKFFVLVWRILSFIGKKSFQASILKIFRRICIRIYVIKNSKEISSGKFLWNLQTKNETTKNEKISRKQLKIKLIRKVAILRRQLFKKSLKVCSSRGEIHSRRLETIEKKSD